MDCCAPPNRDGGDGNDELAAVLARVEDEVEDEVEVEDDEDGELSAAE